MGFPRLIDRFKNKPSKRSWTARFRLGTRNVTNQKCVAADHDAKPIPEPSEGIQKAIESLRQDFAKDGCAPFEHFFCPILHEDVQTELCKGHIVPEACGCKAWVPQRKDVDNFFGSVTEAGFIACLEDQGMDVISALTDKAKHKRLNLKFKVDGDVIGHYFADDPSRVPGHHSSGKLVGPNKDVLPDVVFKLSAEDLKKLEEAEKAGDRLTVEIGSNYLPEMTASLLKAAHLTMFGMFGYEWVFSVPGIDLAAVLRKFYLQHRGKKKFDVAGPLREYFSKHAAMVKPFSSVDSSLLGGTLNDNRVTAFVDGDNRPYAVGIIVKAGNDTFTVFTPAAHDKIDLYYSFLNHSPTSVSMHILELIDQKWQIVHSRRMAFEPNSVA